MLPSLCAVTCSSCRTVVHTSQLEEVFRKLDIDGGGTLDHSQVRKVLINIMGQAEDEEVERMITVMDKDMSGEIDIDEFIDAMM
jgi:Ca2+-binding EF-hand superfamily protein